MSWSFWEKNTFIKEPDVTIIGSGIVGLNAALSLKSKSPSLHVIVLEKGFLPYGASTRNAGFACYGSISELLNDLKVQDPKNVFDLVERRWKGLNRLRQILGDESIVYEPTGGYEVFTSADSETADLCFDKIEYFNQELKKITGQDKIYFDASKKIPEFGFKGINKMILNSGEGQIDTGKMMQSLLEKCRKAGVEILNGVEVSRIENENTNCRIDFNGEFSLLTKKVLIAVNGFAKKFLPDFDVQPARAQVISTSPIPGLQFKGSFHYDHGYYYFRNVGNRVLFGGGRNLDFEKEHTMDFGLTTLVQNSLEGLLKNLILPDTNYVIEQRWSGIMGLGESKTPIIRMVADNIYCAVRMGGMGVAIGSLVGEEAADLILKS
ncbi:MAG: FAD-binding oxidoreductase [Bacteroidetes bacterium]|nr:FAD-binding oxidoreductase [Bacteroidota bacterium]MBK9413328.1 FAD-binding oxidoreductase [Bacteroidota bacterium]MBL0033635.1 FAD-binding oxidoreductase [Bacteroidota bacterium]